MRVLICGDRNWSNYKFMVAALKKFESEKGLITTVIEGCADGADKMAGHQWAVAMDSPEHCITVEHYPAKWDLIEKGDPVGYRRDGTPYNRAAGPRRNQQMLDEGHPEVVIAFHENLASSKGTADMVRRARRAGIPVWIPFKQPQRNMGL